MFNMFIWGERKPRIKHEILQQSIEDGGLATPNVIMYYHATILMQFVTGGHRTI